MTAYKPGDLHPSGYGAVPTALMADDRTNKNHVAAYAAVVSTVDNATGICEALNIRLLDRSGLSYHTLHPAIRDLEEWGYLERLPNRPPQNKKGWKPNRWRILRTPKIKKMLEAEEADDTAALDPVATGREGGKKRQGSRGERDTLEAEEAAKGFAATATGVSRPPRDLSRPPRDSLDPFLDTDLDSLCANAHWRLEDATRAKILKKAVGKPYTVAAIDEVDLRLHHPEVAGEVNDPWALARVIAECYKSIDRCPDPSHGDLHGPAAMSYHRSRQRDADDAKRAHEARRRAPSDPDAEYRDTDVERQRQKAALAESERNARAEAIHAEVERLSDAAAL